MSETTIHSSELGRSVDRYLLQTMIMALDPACNLMTMDSLGALLEVDPSRALRACMEMGIERQIDVPWAWYVAARAQVSRCSVSAMQMPLPAAPPISARPTTAPAPVAAKAPAPAPAQSSKLEANPLMIEWRSIIARCQEEMGMRFESPAHIPSAQRKQVMEMLCHAWRRHRLAGTMMPVQDRVCNAIGISQSMFGTYYSAMFCESPAGELSRRYSEETAPEILRQMRGRVVGKRLSDEDWDALVEYTRQIEGTSASMPLRAIAWYLGIVENDLSERRRAQGMRKIERRHE